MKFKVSLLEAPVHKGHATCIGWNTSEEIFSCGDDNQLYCYNISTNDVTKLTSFPNDFLPTDLQFMPRGPSFGKHNDIFLLTGADGRFHIVNRNGRIERSVEAHKGAILLGKFSFDGAGLLTAGEDGLVKIWSRSGMLRSTVVTSDSPVYGADFSQDSQSILYTQGTFLIIKQLIPNTKPIRWRASECLILCVAWNPTTNLIISGSEDSKYKIWDPTGRLMYSSCSHDYPITAVSWAPQGNLFAIGSFNTLRLCDSAGWSYSLDQLETGSLYKIAWSNDGTEIAAACATGNILIAHLIERKYEWQNYSLCVNEKKTIQVKDILSETEDQLDFSERIIKVAIAYGHLIVTTPIQCYIYVMKNLNTPTIFELKDGSVSHILLSEKYFAIVERASVTVYTYEGRMVATPRWQNMNPEQLNRMQISLSSDTLAVCDQIDYKSVYIFELGSNRSIQDTGNVIQHNNPISHIALSQSGPANDRQMALVDKNKDLFLFSVRGAYKSVSKMVGQIKSLCWNADYNMLAVIQDVRLVVYYTPGAANFSQLLLRMSSLSYDSGELGRSPRIMDFKGTSVSVRRADGSLLNIPQKITSYAIILHENVLEKKWGQALNLCRMVQDTTLWSCLAVLATQAKGDAIDSAEEAYAAINQPEKVIYIQYMKGIRNKSLQAARTAMFAGSMQEAETILLHNGLIYHAIDSYIQMHNYNKALDLAIKHKTHVDTVLYMREKYLSSIQKDETNPKFLKLKDTVLIDKNKVEEKIRMENMKI